ncbi:hypothetical protein GV64_23125 [Endozoicomonas elysicola]|uniref:Uncharacterized protein n=1 Tax=Endozoicomonas elysicola TaxID=305900 RepID=A0A081KGE6_9GAMM|nr:hypothetical protein GV64_23125 [Endozoicomonas elysicola]
MYPLYLADQVAHLYKQINLALPLMKLKVAALFFPIVGFSYLRKEHHVWTSIFTELFISSSDLNKCKQFQSNGKKHGRLSREKLYGDKLKKTT